MYLGDLTRAARWAHLIASCNQSDGFGVKPAFLHVVNQPAQSSVAISYRVKFPLNGFAGKTLIDTVIPAGSTIEWTLGDYAGGQASVLWRRQRVLVMESDIFTKCERAPQS